MLCRLHIRNYAIIDELDIEFRSGLNTITGETGAGKSIILGALSLMIGQRADTSVLKDAAKPCVVEGEFDISGYNLKSLFEHNDIDYADTTIIRRYIGNNGKSRAFVNDLPVNLTLLRQLGERLIDIHSQHQTLLLGSNHFQQKVLDAFAGNKQRLHDYACQFAVYRELKNRLETMEREAETAKNDYDYIKHQLDELNAANLKPDELEQLERDHSRLSHAAEIKQALGQAHAALVSDELAAISVLKERIADLRRIVPFFEPADPLVERLESSRIELKDIADELDRFNADLVVDDRELELLSGRIDTIYSLLRKHRKNSVSELLQLRDDLENRVDFAANFDANLEDLRKRLLKEENRLRELADSLSRARVAVVESLQDNVVELLRQLGIKHADFRVLVEPDSVFHPHGADRIIFLFSANRDVKPRELAKVASGGELSRLMLSLKSLLVKSTDLPTVIFDEIDSGVSGEIADRMGGIIFDMSKGMQVINITHLPQIAAKGDTHFLVCKDENSRTTIRRLQPDERITEIARMLSGEKLSDAAMLNARELLG